MSHEIRTPMNGIMGVLELLDDDNDEEQAKHILLLRQSSQRLLTIINDVLDMSKIEAGRIQINNKPFNLQALICSLSPFLQERAKTKGLEFNWRIDEKITQNLIGDPDRLAQILNNIIGNAVKFTDKGRVDLSIKLVERAADSLKLVFQVEDTGIGIPQEKIANIFNPFFQVDDTYTRKQEGIGLGLSICKKLAQLMGGDIQIKSREGKGTTCSLQIGFKCGEQEAKDNNATVSLAENPLTAKGHALVVEDDAISLYLAKNLIEKCGLSVDSAANGQEAMERLKATDYDIIVMDCQMPIMDGYTLSRAIRHGKAGEKAKGIPIIAMTAHAMQGEEDKCLSAGMSDYVSKPVDGKYLREMIIKWIKTEKPGS